MDAHAEHTDLRELDHHRGDGYDVTLLWSARSGKVYVAVEDARTSEAFRIAVEPTRALDAFNHPYAYGCRGRNTTARATDPVLPNGGRPSAAA
jgi:hypothetical protein